MLKVNLFGYNNPTGRCQSCVSMQTSDLMGCCDRHNTTECSSFLCDTYFSYCLRALGSEQGGECSYFGNVMSITNDDDGFIDFSLSTVLGLDNPLILHVLSNYWNVSLRLIAL